MSHLEEVKLLEQRSKIMLEAAVRELSNKHYDLSVFLAEQAVQLYLKAIVLKNTGTIPRIHSIREIMGALRVIFPGKAYEIDEFVKKNRGLFIRLEEAYISSRYLPRTYDEEEAKELVEFADKVIKFVRGLEV